MTNMLHAMPLRRESWFCTHLTAGLLFCLVPNLLGAGIAAATMGQYAYGAALWLAVMVLQDLFFFGVGVFCVMCAGNRLGAAALYAIVNFLAVLAAWLTEVFYEPMLYGISLPTEEITRLSPVVEFVQSRYLVTYFDNMKDITVLEEIPAAPWIYAGVAAGAGVVLTVLSLLIYRKRALESAGDFICLKPVSPVFLVLYTLCVGSAVYFVFSGMDGIGRLFMLLLGLGIGFFTGQMLLQKKVKVFKWRSILAFVILVVAFGLTQLITYLDPLGITRYVPETQAISTVQISPNSYLAESRTCTLTEPEDFEMIRALHQQALQDRYSQKLDEPITILYKLKNGGKEERNYYISRSGENVQTLQNFYSRANCVLGTDDKELFLKNMQMVTFHPYNEDLPFLHIDRTGSQPYYDLEKYEAGTGTVLVDVQGSFGANPMARSLVEALFLDCMAGTMSQWYSEAETVGYMDIELRQGSTRNYVSIAIYKDCKYTMNFLDNLITEE